MHVGIVGAGLSGLAVANELKSLGHSAEVFEKSSEAGGRVKTKSIDGHLVDAGFQIFIEGYPEAKRMLTYSDLNLKQFSSGALVRKGDEFYEIEDPLRNPKSIVRSYKAPIGNLADKLRLLKFRFDTTKGSIDEIWQRKDIKTIDLLKSKGFSDQLIDNFLKPLLTGITLDPNLESSSRSTEFVYRMLAQSSAAIPAKGMAEIPKQLAENLNESLHLNQTVDGVTPHQISAEGENHEFDAVVVATEIDCATQWIPELSSPGWKSSTSIWFKAPEAPVASKAIILGGKYSPIGNAAIMSNVSSAYAPNDSATIVVSSPTPLEPAVVKAELKSWFGSVVELWEILDVQRINKAQPKFEIGEIRRGYYRAHSGVWACGDYLDDASINGALASGRKTAQALLATL